MLCVKKCEGAIMREYVRMNVRMYGCMYMCDIVNMVVIHVSEVCENEVGITRLNEQTSFMPVDLWADWGGSSCSIEQH